MNSQLQAALLILPALTVPALAQAPSTPVTVVPPLAIQETVAEAPIRESDPPVVRLPGSTLLPPIARPLAPSRESTVPSPLAPASAAPTSVPSALPSANPSIGTSLGFAGDGVSLRTTPAGPMRTNRWLEMRGAIPRASRSERRGFGGFLGGFANLFNPFAPTQNGVATSESHWYDGQVVSAPRPRGFQDERYHEAKTELLVIDLDGAVQKPAP